MDGKPGISPLGDGIMTRARELASVFLRNKARHYFQLPRLYLRPQDVFISHIIIYNGYFPELAMFLRLSDAPLAKPRRSWCLVIMCVCVVVVVNGGGGQ